MADNITGFETKRYIVRERYDNGPWTIEEKSGNNVIAQIERRMDSKQWIFASYCESFLLSELSEIVEILQRVNTITEKS